MNSEPAKGNNTQQPDMLVRQLWNKPIKCNESLES